ncbi:Ig-like domain repeat protein [Leucobacter weissii]|uniref:Ig-like domain repeat protein n=1 Tax=Leucobacter weissii TaxID=1983706 RepID=A0A939MNV2_9MICO|nr:Ig-like domain repeat protein [Leucobacter weissii]MBO1902237.1 Ig-like domain repeat protein [Leucobacter weissii]
MFEQSSRRTRRSVGFALSALLVAGVLVPATALGAAAEETEAVSPYPTTTTMHGTGLGSGLPREFCDVNKDGVADLSGATTFGIGTAGWWDTEARRNTDGVAAVNASTTVQWTAASVAGGCAGDVNGDGLDDVLPVPATTARVVSVNISNDVLSSAGRHQTSRLANYTFPTGSSNYGVRALGSAGDLDRDGLGDVVVSQHTAAADGRTGSGRLWVLAGRPSPTVPTAIQAHAIAESVSDNAPDVVAAVISGEVAGDQLGTAKSVGDVNGDGVDDLLVASQVSQKAWLIWGKARGAAPRQIDLANLDASDGVLFATATGGSGFGAALSVIDDVNGDGVQDYLFGRATTAPATVGATSDTGGAVVVFGTPIAPGSTPEPVVVDTAAKTVATGAVVRGYVIEAEASGDALGFSVAGGGDYNGDGRSDLLLGAPGFDPVIDGAASTDSGAVYVVYGKADGAAQPLVGLSESAGYRIDGIRGESQQATRPSAWGYSVSRVGDIDANGVEDFAYGAPGYTRYAAASYGTVFVALRGDVDTQLALDTSVRVGDTGAVVNEQNDVFAAGEAFDLRANLQLSTLKGYSGDLAFALDGQTLDGCAAVRTAEPLRGTVHQSFGTCDAGVEVREYGVHRFGAGFAGAGHVQASETASIPVFVTDASETDLEVRRTSSGGSLRLTATVRPVSSEKTVDEGAVTFTRDGETLGEAAVADGVAVLTVPLPADGEYTFAASFGGYTVDKADDTDELVTLLAASEGETAHTVVSDPAEASFGLSRDTVEYGKSATATVATGGAGAVRFTVDGGEPVEVAVVNGIAEHPLEGLTVGDHAVSAVFVPEDGSDPVPAGSGTVTVTKASTALSAVRLGKTSSVYGAAGVAASVRVTGTDAGTVTFWNGSTRVGSATASAGQVSVVLPKTLAAGKRQITARLAETGTHQAAVAAANTVTVAKAKPAKVAVTGKKFTKRTKPRVTVQVAKLNNGSYPVGKVRVQVGSSKKTVTLTAAKKGKVTVTLAKRYTKSVSVRATFLPKDTKNVASKTSAKKTIKVKK